MLNPINKTIELADGRTITIETGKLAKQADGAVTVRMGNTVLLATVCAAKDANPGVDFMPLQVEYKEKFSAFGRFPGGFTKREGKASDYEILTSRLVDRALRPLFPDNYHAEVYVNVILFSADGEDMPDALAGLAASAALAVSDIPFNGPISECRVARIDGKYVVNPTFSELEKADIDIMVGATLDNIMMVEGEMDEVQESEMLEAIKVAHEAIKIQCQAQLELSEACGKLVKREYCHEINDDELRKDVHEKCYAKAYAVATSGTDKHQRAEAFEAVVEEYKAQFSEEELTDEKVEMDVTVKELFDFPAGVDVVHIGIQDDLEHHPGMVRAAPAFLIQLPETFKVQALNQSVNHPNWIMLCNILVNSWRKKHCLVGIVRTKMYLCHSIKCYA